MCRNVVVDCTDVVDAHELIRLTKGEWLQYAPGNRLERVPSSLHITTLIATNLKPVRPATTAHPMHHSTWLRPGCDRTGLGANGTMKPRNVWRRWWMSARGDVWPDMLSNRCKGRVSVALSFLLNIGKSAVTWARILPWPALASAGQQTATS
jgi:hypothetical protein